RCRPVASSEKPPALKVALCWLKLTVPLMLPSTPNARFEAVRVPLPRSAGSDRAAEETDSPFALSELPGAARLKPNSAMVIAASAIGTTGCPWLSRLRAGSAARDVSSCRPLGGATWTLTAWPLLGQAAAAKVQPPTVTLKQTPPIGVGVGVGVLVGVPV